MVRTPEIDEWGRVKASGNAAIEDGQTKLHDRLTKILALTRSPDEQEAGMAAAKLQQLLTEHNLSMADLERRGQKSPGMREGGHDLGKAAFGWKLDLAEGIAEFHYCAPLVDRRKKTVAFIGRPDNVEALQLLYGWVIDQVKRIATEERRAHYDKTGEHIDPLRWQIGFGEGAVVRLVERMKELRARQQEDMSRNEMGDVTALTIHHQAEVSDYLEEKFGYRIDGKKTKKELEADAHWEEYLAERKREAEEKDELRIRCEESGDMEPYYTKYPRERPDAIAKREAEMDKLRRKWAKQEERNAKRRTGSYRPGKQIDHEKEGQSESARASGHAAASRVNLQPFISGNVDRKKVSNG